MDIRSFIRQDIRDFVPYSVENKPHRFKLDANESPYPLPDAVKRKALAWLAENENFNTYPDTDNTDLRNTLAGFYGLKPENFTCGVGSDQLIDYITKVFLEAGEVSVVMKPTFSMYAISTVINHGRVVEAAPESGADGIIAAAKESGAKLVFLCTPNNPTGGSFTEDELVKVLTAVKCPVVVDEAYVEFSGRTMVEHINKFPHMIILKTFSKAYGLAGARVGYAIACTEMIDAINLVRAPYNLPTFSQFLASEALKESDEYKRRAAVLTAEKDALIARLRGLPGLVVHDSDANFIFIESGFGTEGRDIARKLLDGGVLVRDFGGGKIRLTVGLPEQNEVVFGILEDMK